MNEIEMAVIGCLILWNKEFATESESLSESDFSMPECREIFKAIKKFNGEDVDHAILLSIISAESKAIAVNACENYVASQSSFSSYLMRLKEFSTSRKIKEKLTPYILNNEEIITSEQLIDIANENKNEVVSSYAEKARESLKGFSQRAVQKNNAISTGFSTIDRITGGLRVPSVSIIGALPSTGKTSFALNIAWQQISEAKKTVIFSLEMSSDMIYERLVSIGYNVNYNNFSTRKFTENDKKILNDFEKTIKNMQLYVYDDVYDIETQTLICNQLKPEFVFVDYMQKVTSKEKSESRRAEIERISSRYKQIANRVGCHVMLLSQLSRGSDSQPTMRNLKESGALEADGDYIMILNRPYVYNKAEHNPRETTLLIDKNKFGSTGIMNMQFDGAYQKFCEEVNDRYEQ